MYHIGDNIEDRYGDIGKIVEKTLYIDYIIYCVRYEYEQKGPIYRHLDIEHIRRVL